MATGSLCLVCSLGNTAGAGGGTCCFGLSSFVIAAAVGAGVGTLAVELVAV